MAKTQTDRERVEAVIDRAEGRSLTLLGSDFLTTSLIVILDAAGVDDVAEVVAMLEAMGVTKDGKRVNQDDSVFVVSGRNIDTVRAGSCNIGVSGKLNRGEHRSTGSGDSFVFNWEVYSTLAAAQAARDGEAGEG